MNEITMLSVMMKAGLNLNFARGIDGFRLTVTIGNRDLNTVREHIYTCEPACGASAIIAKAYNEWREYAEG